MKLYGKVSGAVLLAEEIKHRQELYKGPGPSVEQDNGNRIWLCREEANKVDGQTALLIVDTSFEVRKCVHVGFVLAPR